MLNEYVYLFAVPSRRFRVAGLGLCEVKDEECSSFISFGQFIKLLKSMKQHRRLNLACFNIYCKY